MVDYYSFTLGIYAAVQLYALMKQFKYLKKKLLGKIPFIMQLFWTLCNLTYFSHSAGVDGADYLRMVSNILDFLTKVTVIYFICIRITIISKIKNNVVKSMLYIFFGVGVILSFFGLFYYLFFNHANEEEKALALAVSNWIYIFLDLYISIIELASLTIYLFLKYDLKSFSKIGPCIKNSRLQFITIFIVMTAILSVAYVFFYAFHFDDAWNWSAIISTLK